MYDHIHFNTQSITTPITHKNYYDILPPYYDSSFLDQDKDILAFLTKGTYLIDGIVRLCIPHPITKFAQENLFYIQSFSLLNCQKQYFTRRENLDSFLLLYTYEGQGCLEYMGKSFTLSKGEGFFINCQDPHFYKTNEKNWFHADLHFSGAFTNEIFKQFSQSGNVKFSLSDADMFHPKLENLIELYESVTPFRELQISNQLENLLMTILMTSSLYERSSKNLPENIKYLVKYIENNYMKPLTLDFLSEFAGISKYHLIRVFKKYLGYSPRDYIIQLQLEHSKSLLETTSLPANKIGRIVGVNNENYFSHLFKSKIGVSPGEYRKQHAAK